MRHGYAGYRIGGCRCYVCAFARSEYDGRRNAMIAAGAWMPFVSIEPVRTHVQSLKAVGFGDRQIAALSGLERKTVRDISAGIRHDPGRGNPPMTRVRAATAAAILAVVADPMEASDGTYIDATETHRQIAALQRAGLSAAAIARALGKRSPALQIHGDRVTVRNARAIRALYLDHYPPTRPADDVDWAVVVRLMAGDKDTKSTPAERTEVVARMTALGMSASQIAERTGWSARTVERWRAAA